MLDPLAGTVTADRLTEIPYPYRPHHADSQEGKWHTILPPGYPFAVDTLQVPSNFPYNTAHDSAYDHGNSTPSRMLGPAHYPKYTPRSRPRNKSLIGGTNNG